nr:hypothetical protein [Tanacetum cinerariifolium]
MLNVPLPQGIRTSGSPRCQETTGGSIAQTRSKRVPTPPHDSPLPRVNTLGTDEGSMSLHELTTLCTTLLDMVLALETNLRQTKKVYGTAYTNLIMKVKKLEKTVKSNQARRRTKIVVSNDEEDLEDSSKQGRMIEDINQDTRITLVTPTNVNTYTRRKRVVSTGSEGVSTASRIFSPAEESVSTVGESMPDSTADVIQEGIKDKEKERTKRARLNLQEESSKRQKTKEGSKLIEEPKVDEKSQEDLQQMMMIVPVEEVYVKALQVKYPIIDWERFDKDDLVKLWEIIKERFSTTEPTDDKEKALWVKLKILFELDNDDIIWKL